MIAARALGAALLTPLGGPLPRLTWGLIAAVYLATRRGEALDGPLALILAELLLGAALGLLASLPIYASMALGGEGLRALGRLGPLWAWGIFFSVNGPALWLMGLAQSAEAWPDALTPAPMGAAGTALLYAALLLGAPTWLSHLSVELALMGAHRGGQPAPALSTPARILLSLLALMWSLSALEAWLAGLWRRALGGWA